MNSRNSLKSWKFLETHALEMSSRHLKELFEIDEARFSKFSMKIKDLLFDYSKNLVTSETLSALIRLAEDCNVEDWRSRMFAGEAINSTENRAVLHVALRDPSGRAYLVEGVDISLQVRREMQRMEAFVDEVRAGSWRGFSGKTITDVVSLGVGGSNLGPQMVTEALKGYGDGRIRVHYVSNVDGAQIAETLRSLNPERVLFVVASKTFTTTETMTNARTALSWLSSAAFDRAVVEKHFVAITANEAAARTFGIPGTNTFHMWDWVGGRYSLWSSIGLPIALSLGFDTYRQLLKGAHQMDKHFENAPLPENAPVILALIGVWNSTFLGAQSQVILPYDQNLHRLPAYLQQADMESNGKSVSREGAEVSYATGPIVWGESGINGQHAFYQLLHQGRTIIPADFIGSINSVTPVNGHHEHLMANFFAQSQALMIGVDEESVRRDLLLRGLSLQEVNKIASHKVHRGNRPSNTLLMNKLNAETLGALIALYEHKIFVQGVIWGINSFDQWGVELGKSLAKSIEAELISDSNLNHHDSSTRNLIMHYRAIAS